MIWVEVVGRRRRPPHGARGGRPPGDFRQSLACLHVSHPPAFYTLVLEVWRFLHKRPSGVPGVSEGISSDAYQH